MPRHYIDTILFFICIVAYINIGNGLKIESVVGGCKADDEDILYQASLIIKGSARNEPDAPCAGAAVSYYHLVSIASCFMDEFGIPYRRWYEVKVGVINLRDNSSIIIGVETIYIPENYNWLSSANNVAVIKLNQSLDFSLRSRLTRVDLPTSRSSFRKKIAVFSAYGYHLINVLNINQYAYTGIRDWHLRSLPVRVIENKKCQRSWPAIMDNQLCGKSIAERRNQHSGACVGDLGGPLVFENQLIGVLSKFNPLCIDNEHPSIYTRISSVKSFIQSVLNGRPPRNARVYTEQTYINRMAALRIF